MRSLNNGEIQKWKKKKMVKNKKEAYIALCFSFSLCPKLILLDPKGMFLLLWAQGLCLVTSQNTILVGQVRLARGNLIKT